MDDFIKEALDLVINKYGFEVACHRNFTIKTDWLYNFANSNVARKGDEVAIFDIVKRINDAK